PPVPPVATDTPLTDTQPLRATALAPSALAPFINVLVNRGRRQLANAARLTAVLDGAMTVLPGAFRLVRRRHKTIPVRVQAEVVNGQTVVRLRVRRAFLNGQPLRGRVRVVVKAGLVQDVAGHTLAGDLLSRAFKLRGHSRGRGRKTALVLAAPITLVP